MDDAQQRALDDLTSTSTGDPVLAATCVHPDSVNRMAVEQPPACSEPGVPGAMATSAWLRFALTDLHFEPIDITSDGERTVAHVWMTGRQTGPLVFFPAGSTPVSFPPTGRECAVRQCHMWLLRDNLLTEHTGVRDDLGMMTQLGHLPPSLTATARVLRWHLTGGHRRAVGEAITVAQRAADAVHKAWASDIGDESEEMPKA